MNYEEFVKSRLGAGDSPNDITRRTEEAIGSVATDWELWGNGRWYLNTVCSICGSGVPGICEHARAQAQRVILLREYEASKRVEA